MITKQNIPVRWRDNPKEYHRLYELKHRARINENHKMWALRNAEKRRKIQKAYKDKNLDRLREQNRLYAKTHKAEMKLSRKRRLATKEGRSKLNEYLRQRSKLPEIQARRKAFRRSEHYRAYNRLAQGKRRAKILSLHGDDTKTLKRLYSIVRNNLSCRCYYCGIIIRGKDAHIDHVHPLSKGGPHAGYNLCIACAACNLSKHDKPVNSWDNTNQFLLI